MMNDLSKLRNWQTISVSPENLTGEKGKGGAMPWEQGSSASCARDLGTGWKVNPRMFIPAHETLTLADVKDQGEITQIWLTPTGYWRGQILRFYWDGEETPAVEVPLGDFFACGLNKYAQVSSLAVCVNPGSAFTARASASRLKTGTTTRWSFITRSIISAVLSLRTKATSMRSSGV